MHINTAWFTRLPSAMWPSGRRLLVSIRLDNMKKGIKSKEFGSFKDHWKQRMAKD